MKWKLITISLAFMTCCFFELGAETKNTAARVEFKGQKKSVFDWGRIPVDSFLSFEDWKKESDIRDQIPDWEKSIRERNYREMVGRIYQCVGICRVDRGEGFFNGRYLSALYEGDEIQTIDDSYTWIFLFDGTMVRLSPKSSITFNEFNVGIKENFINARVNAGNILWLSRKENSFEEMSIRETDVTFYPYSEYESLPIQDTKTYREDDLIELISSTDTYLNHYKSLNEKVKNNNKKTLNKPTYAFLVMPNSTLMGLSPSVDIYTFVGGETIFKNRSNETLGLNKKENEDESSSELFLQLRGYENKTLITAQEDEWITVDEKGRSYALSDDVRWLDVGELITKRIPSIMHGREIFLERYSEFAFRPTYDPMALAKNDGYRLWGTLANSDPDKKDDLELRLDFLKEYFRRTETSNLLAASRFKERLESRGEKGLTIKYGNYFFINALNRYYKFGEKYRDNSNDKENGEVLNSTKKLLWKKMHGIR